MSKKNHLLIFILLFILFIGSLTFVLTNSISNAKDIPVIKNISEKISKPKTNGLTMFRGNISRNFYGTGPIPTNPKVLWKYPKTKPLCASSTVAGVSKVWCGSGWTGQPVVWENPNGITEIIVGTYDRSIHFINSETGEATREPFPTGDIIKGSVTLDPDGFPLLYSGSRDNFYRIIALDREVPTELWKIEAKISDGVWNNDWDGNGLIENDILYEGSENGIFHAIKLNRSYDESGKVKVEPKELVSIPTFSKDFIALVGDDDLSIESSPLKIGDVVYVANSGGRIMGFDVSEVLSGNAPTVFDFWTGDDTDATLITDDKGFIYAVSEEERLNQRSKEIGQIIKLDTKKPENPLVWNIHVPKRGGVTGGVWATPAIYKDYLYVTTNPGELLTIDKNSGEVLSRIFVGDHAWSSPNVVDDVLTIGTCQGSLKAFSLTNPNTPTEIWSLPIGGESCIESTPAIWKGNFYFGTREGHIFKVGQK
jgi:outer membrane protein assembly factor BamB